MLAHDDASVASGLFMTLSSFGDVQCQLSLHLPLRLCVRGIFFASNILFLAVCGQIPPFPSWFSSLPNVIIHVSDILGHRFTRLNFQRYKEL